MVEIVTYRFRCRVDGLFLGRNLTLNESLRALARLLTLREPLLRQCPAPWRPGLELTLQEANALHEEILDGAEPLPPAAPLEVPEELLVFGSVEEMNTVRYVDDLLNGLLGELATFVGTFAKSVRSRRNREIGKRLEARWFYDGRTFWRLPYEDQWAETERRFRRLTDQERSDVDTLALGDHYRDLMALNRWFALLQGINPDVIPEPEAPAPDPAQPPPPAPVPLPDRAEQFLAQILSTASAIWPKDTPEHNRARALMTAPVLDIIQQKSQR